MTMRNDFLEMLARKYYSAIAFTVRNTIGKHATAEVIRNEGTQAFLMAANRAIDSARLIDDGRNKNDPEKWCKMKGLLGIIDFFRRGEWGTRNKHVGKVPGKVIYAQEMIPEHNESEDPEPIIFADTRNYEELIVSHLDVQETIRNLEPYDRQIIELLVYGQTGTERLRCSGRYGAATRNVAADIAFSLGRHESFVYRRLGRIRETLLHAV